MGKTVEDYDAQLMPYRFSYTKAVAQEQWLLAAHWVDLLNSCIHPTFRIIDLPAFEFTPTTLRQQYELESEARMFCLKYMRLVEQAISLERSKMLQIWKGDN